MANVLVVETKPSKNSFKDFNFEYDRVTLSSDPNIKKLLRKDVTIEKAVADKYEWVVLVGSEPFKFFTGKSSVTEYAGKVVEEKFIPTINPGMLAFKPEARKLWEDSVKSINEYVTGKRIVRSYDSSKFVGINDKLTAINYIKFVSEQAYPFFALDSETTALYPRNGHMLGISISGSPNTGAYISTDCIDDEVAELLQSLIRKKTVVFHNAKFDLAFFQYHFNFEFPLIEDTMLLHYVLDERPGNHGLKQLALQHTEYGDYEEPLYEWIDEYCKKHGILKSAFTWDLIPYEVMINYAAIDACVTFLLYDKFKRAVEKNSRLNQVYNTILIPGVRFLTKIQDNGVPFDADRLKIAQKIMDENIQEATKRLYEYPEIKEFEAAQEEQFNPNSVQQLRKLLFDYLNLAPTGAKTGTGADSTNAEVLETLSEEHEVPKLILQIRKDGKIKNTYLDKIIPELDRDSRLRTNFNLHGTTSGRLSSSGKLNMQQLPRDNPAVKGCIKARDGYKIVSMDLTTAEVYIAAVLSKDKELMDVFQSKGNFHSTIAKKVFALPCEVEDVVKLYPDRRQAAKAVTFGILYGAGASKISAQVTKDSGNHFSKGEAQEVINDYFGTFKALKRWLKKSEEEIAAHGYVYSHFGRKRRLRNITSSDAGTVAHEIRSGINFLIQSPSSDINLLGAIDMQKIIETKKMDASIFALVHDSILAEVKESEVEEYCQLLKNCIETDRGLTIPGCPIGTEFEVGDDYSFGKFEEKFLKNNTELSHN
jgi:DNA polymerase I-like protein with 3'-5' exonuclease and polymerase domains